MTTPPSLEGAAAELTAALHSADGTAEPLPAALAARIVAAGEAQLREAASLRTSVEATPSIGARADASRRVAGAPLSSRDDQRRALRVAASAGWLAAAASLGVWAWSPRGAEPVSTSTASVSMVGPSSVVALRDSLLADSTTMVRVWAPSTDPAARSASGDVVWNPTQQRGVMRLVGLAPNDPRLAQYQLWIIDAARDARYPVDGGVFDVTESGEVFVAIGARLPVDRPTLFAITLERPGGVVVSTRERLVLAAPVEG